MICYTKMKDGDRVKLVLLIGDRDPMPEGTLGTIVKANVTILGSMRYDVHWDCDIKCAVFVPPDRVELHDDIQ